MAKNSSRITNFSCLFSLVEKKFAKKEQSYCVEHGISQTSHQSSAASKSTSTGAQYVTLDNKIKCLTLAFYFGNLTNKIVHGTGYI
jgi:hypothetical protein